jgi:hypothetical protein
MIALASGLGIGSSSSAPGSRCQNAQPRSSLVQSGRPAAGLA